MGNVSVAIEAPLFSIRSSQYLADYLSESGYLIQPVPFYQS